MKSGFTAGLIVSWSDDLLWGASWVRLQVRVSLVLNTVGLCVADSRFLVGSLHSLERYQGGLLWKESSYMMNIRYLETSFAQPVYCSTEDWPAWTERFKRFHLNRQDDGLWGQWTSSHSLTSRGHFTSPTYQDPHISRLPCRSSCSKQPAARLDKIDARPSRRLSQQLP